MVGCANGAVDPSNPADPGAWPTTKLATAAGCFDEQAGFAPDVAECHAYLGAWPSCGAPDATKDVYDTCADGNTLIETDGSGRHEHADGTEDALEINCTAWCDQQLGWDGCYYSGVCTTEPVSCQGGTVQAGLCGCTQGGAKKPSHAQVIDGECVRTCCDVDGTLNWITPAYCHMYGGTDLGEDFEDCF
jgi:hypothetical protein